MINQIATARAAISSEIKSLTAQVSKLQRVLDQLNETGGASAAPAAPMTGKRGRGRPRLNTKASASQGDVSNALKLIEEAGKKGVKAIRLAFLIKQAGGNRPTKDELLGTEKVKMTGKGGGSTYVWTA